MPQMLIQLASVHLQSLTVTCFFSCLNHRCGRNHPKLVAVKPSAKDQRAVPLLCATMTHQATTRTRNWTMWALLLVVSTMTLLKNRDTSKRKLRSSTPTTVTLAVLTPFRTVNTWSKITPLRTPIRTHKSTTTTDLSLNLSLLSTSGTILGLNLPPLISTLPSRRALAHSTSSTTFRPVDRSARTRLQKPIPFPLTVPAALRWALVTRTTRFGETLWCDQWRTGALHLSVLYFFVHQLHLPRDQLFILLLCHCSNGLCQPLSLPHTPVFRITHTLARNWTNLARAMAPLTSIYLLTVWSIYVYLVITPTYSFIFCFFSRIHFPIFEFLYHHTSLAYFLIFFSHYPKHVTQIIFFFNLALFSLVLITMLIVIKLFFDLIWFVSLSLSLICVWW